MQTEIKTGNKLIDNFYPGIKNFLLQDQVTYIIDGERVHGYRSPDCNAIWLRDHSDILRGARYFESDMLSGITHFAQTQRANGSLFDFVSCAMDRENWTKYVRVPVEADVEYRFVKAIYLAWQATGNDEWLNWMLPFAEKALHYTLTHPWRWDKTHQLVKRAYTMDTWDFDYVSPDQPWLNFQISDKTHWGIFHGDNSGFYEAFQLMARLYYHLDNDEKQTYWSTLAENLQARTNQLCWNGRFYTHRIPLDDFRIAGVGEHEQLSFSNPSAINRGLASHEMAVAMLREYQQRKQQRGAFAEWFSMDPPFPDGAFGDPKLVQGAYINGGIMPLVGGELARAAFEHGFERYAWSILKQYAQMIDETNATYLWYFPDGTSSSVETSTSPEATPTDGWGSSAMLYALMEGLAGVVDQDHLLKKIRFSPRWSVAGIEQAQVCIQYGASDAAFQYEYISQPNRVKLRLKGTCKIDLHFMLPPNKSIQKFKINQKETDFNQSKIEATEYLDKEFQLNHEAELELYWK